MLYGLETDLFEFNQNYVSSNLSKEEKIALKELIDLQKKGRIVIQRADKGGAVVLQNVTDYIQEAERQLRDTEFYEKVDRDLTEAHTELKNNTIERFQRENLIPERTAKGLKTTKPNRLVSTHSQKSTKKAIRAGLLSAR